MAATSWEAEKQRLASLFALADHIPALGDCRRIDISGPIHVSAHARLYLCKLPHKSDRFLAKCFYREGTDHPDIDEARHQYEALLHLNSGRGLIPGFNLVKPFHLFADHGIVVQSWFDGQSLDKAFGNAARSARELKALTGEAGTWLAHYHRFGSDGQTTPVRAGLLDEIEQGAQALGRSGNTLVEISRALRQSSLFDGNHMQPVTRLHCDFKPGNLIATRHGICAIDFQLSKRASVYFDIAHFLNSMTIDLIKARRPALLLSARAMHNEFVTRYNEAAEAVDPLTLAYHLVYDLGRYMLQYGDMRAPSVASRIKWWALERLLMSRARYFQSLDGRRQHSDTGARLAS